MLVAENVSLPEPNTAEQRAEPAMLSTCEIWRRSIGAERGSDSVECLLDFCNQMSFDLSSVASRPVPVHPLLSCQIILCLPIIKTNNSELSFIVFYCFSLSK